MVDRTLRPPVCEPIDMKLVTPEQHILPNGIPVYVLDAGDSEVVRMDVLVGGGRWQQTQPLQALFTNRMLREGTRRYRAMEIAERLDYYGAWLELSNSSKFASITLYSLSKYLPHTLEVLESLLKEPLFPEGELELVVNNNVQQFLINSSKVDFHAHRALVKAVYGEQHPCGRLVQEDDYRRITPSVLREFYDRFYYSDNCSIYLSGKVDKRVLDLVEERLGTPFGRGGKVPEQRKFIPCSSAEKRIFVEKADAMQAAVRMGMLSIGCNHPDYLKLRVVITLLGGYFGSRLMSNVREEKGYTYGISAGIMSYPEHGLLVINAETANEYVEPLIGEVYREINHLQNDLVPEAELKMVRNYMLGDMCRSYESVFSLADAWIFVHTSEVKESYFTDLLQAVRNITPCEIRDLAGRYLCKETLKEVVCGKKMS